MRNSREVSAGGSTDVPAISTAGLAGKGAEFGEHHHPEMGGAKRGGCGDMVEGCTCAAIQVWAPQ